MSANTQTKANRRGGVLHTVLAADGGLIRLHLTRKLAMECMCTECLGFDVSPSDCTSTRCPLYPFRAGTLRTKKSNVDASGNQL